MDDSFYQAVKRNCDISDARDNGIYSICTLVLKLRNLYKWEHGLNPWEEPDPPELLDWIGAREEYWETIHGEKFSPIPLNGGTIDPFLPEAINPRLSSVNLLYGAGYGRSMKAVFFLADVLEERWVEGCQTFILGREKARELSGPFAMLQNNTIYIRKEPMRFFFWDQIQEISPSCRLSMQQALKTYGLMADDSSFDRNKLIDTFERIVDAELEIFVYHEVGESRENLLTSSQLKKIIGAYPGTAIELLARAVKDILADTHPAGLLPHIVAREKKSSLGFYLAFLDGMRKLLCREVNEAGRDFWESGSWSQVRDAVAECRLRNEAIAHRFLDMNRRLDRGDSPGAVRRWAENKLLAPLGLMVPAGEEKAT